MKEQAYRGRRLLLAIIFCTVAFSVSVIVVQVALGTFKTSSLIRTCIEVGLLYQVWRGSRWARWLMTFLYAVGGSFGVLYALKIGLPSSLILLAMGVAYYLFALLLSWSADLDAFFQAKRARRKERSIDEDFA